MATMNEMEHLNKSKICELRVVAKEYAIVGRWHMKKKKLKDSIKEVMNKVEEGILPCQKTRNDLTKEAKDLGIVGVGSLNKDGLRKVIEERKRRNACGKDEVVICIHEKYFFRCYTCRTKRLCIHGKKRYFCKDCDGTQICKHDKKLFNCYSCAEERRRERKNRWYNRGEKTEANNVDEGDARRDKSNSDEGDHATPCVRVVADWITDGEEEDEGEVVADPVGRRFEGERRIRGGCLIEGYDNIYDLVADLNARDN